MRRETLLMCRICDQKISAILIKTHSTVCKEKAQKKKELLEINIKLSQICDEAYEKKHNF